MELLRERAQSWHEVPWTPSLRGLRLLYDIPRQAGPTLAVVRSVVLANHRLDPFDALVLASHAVAVARHHRLDYGFFAATLLQESAFAPDALSAAGAVGIAQFTLGTAEDEGVDPFDWQSAMDGCATLLGRYVATYDGVYADPYAAALAAYNAGPGTVAYYHGMPPYVETRAYVSDIYDRWSRIVGDAGGRATSLNLGTGCKQAQRARRKDGPVTSSGVAAPAGERFFLYRSPERAAAATFADDVRAGLTAERKRLAPKYFYDELGSALFEAICVLPEYYLTRAEVEILERFGAEIVGELDGPIDLVEFGSGSARKTRLLVAAALDAQERLEYRPIDISPSALVGSAEFLVAEYDRLTVSAYASDYVELLQSARLRTSRRVLALFLGSNIGNYESAAAESLLQAMSAAFKPGDALLLGTDLKKDAAVLELAYNDPTGVTAAFNKNLLARINRELGGTFDLDGFEHAARYDARRGSVDSFLVARRGMRVRIDALDAELRLATAEAIHTESSYKFDFDDVARLAERSGFRVARRWLDRREQFAVTLLRIV